MWVRQSRKNNGSPSPLTGCLTRRPSSTAHTCGRDGARPTPGLPVPETPTRRPKPRPGSKDGGRCGRGHKPVETLPARPQKSPERQHEAGNPTDTRADSAPRAFTEDASSGREWDLREDGQAGCGCVPGRRGCRPGILGAGRALPRRAEREQEEKQPCEGAAEVAARQRGKPGEKGHPVEPSGGQRPAAPPLPAPGLQSLEKTAPALPATNLASRGAGGLGMWVPGHWLDSERGRQGPARSCPQTCPGSGCPA